MPIRVSLLSNSPPTRTIAAPRRSSLGQPRAMPRGRQRAAWRRCTEPMAVTRLAPDAVSSAVAVPEVTTIADFDAMQTDWNRLGDQLEVPGPVQTRGWDPGWWNHFGEGRSVRGLGVVEGGRGIRTAPLFRPRP